MFCPKCGSMLKPKMDKKRKLLVCSCGYKNDKEGGVIKEEFEGSKPVEVISDDDENKRYPITDATCSKCKHTKAYFWTQQTRGADEPETRFFKCEKCKNVWREYS